MQLFLSPLTPDELIYIEEQREKTKFEGSLPPTSDEACFVLRRQLMEGQEVREWQRRERNIKKLQKNKLNLLQNLLEEREKLAEEENQKRIFALKQKKTETKNKLQLRLNKQKVKILRKIMAAKRAFGKLKGERTLIDEYQDFASRVYASMTRDGLCVNSLAQHFDFKFPEFQSLGGFLGFIESLKPEDLEFNVRLEDLVKLHSKKVTKLERHHR